MNGSAHAGNIKAAYVCHSLNHINSRGLFCGDDPLDYSVPSLLLQLSLVSIITRVLYFLLKPIGQPSIVAQIIGGVILGPSVLGRNLTFLQSVFPSKARALIDTIAAFGFVLFIFIIGVKMDLSMVIRSGRKALAVGILGFFVPLVLTVPVAFILSRYVALDINFAAGLAVVAGVQSMTAFPVVTLFLDELKILNSEMGRLASSSSVVCDVCLWSVVCIKAVVGIVQTESLKVIFGSILSGLVFIIVIIFVIRPAAFWVIRNTPEGRQVKELYIIVAIIVLMCTCLAGEAIGITATIASLVLGLAIPDGPPLGAALVDKLDCSVNVILMPLFIILSGLQTDIFEIQSMKNFGVVQLVVLVALFAKIIGTTLPLIFCRMPFRDALSLGLIMSSKGIVEVAFLVDMKSNEIITGEIFSILIITVIVLTGVISPIVKVLYDPSKRYVAYKRRTILHCGRNDELRVLACIHSEEHVHSIINLLQVSNPTKVSPINLIVLHLIRLKGRASSLLVAHRHRDKPSPQPTQSQRIFVAFEKFEQLNPGSVLLTCYKGISPHVTMHNDVCSLALEKRTILIILPFYKPWTHEERGESSYAYRHLNRSVLEKAPCSVGILINHASFKRSRHVITEPSSYCVGVLFFGGADDRESLTYAQRMSEHSGVSVTLIRFIASSSDIVTGTERSKMLDSEILSSFKLRSQQTDDLAYEEKTVTNGTDVVITTRSSVNAYNLVIVGRRHSESPIMMQLARWNNRGELGAIGEILAALEFKGNSSVLVVQQQSKLWGLKDPEESTHLRRIKL